MTESSRQNGCVGEGESKVRWKKGKRIAVGVVIGQGSRVNSKVVETAGVCGYFAGSGQRWQNADGLPKGRATVEWAARA